MPESSLFEQDRAVGARLIASFPNLCTATDIRTLPGLEHETDEQIERRILGSCFWLFYGRQDGRVVFWKNDVRDWWEKFCRGEAYYSSALLRWRLPVPAGGRFDRSVFNEGLYESLVEARKRRALAEAKREQL